VRRALNSAAAIESRYDFNRDRRVNALDLGIVRANLFRTAAPITPPAPAPASSAASGTRRDDGSGATGLLTGM
jgi:hypothetical protein